MLSSARRPYPRSHIYIIFFIQLPRQVFTSRLHNEYLHNVTSQQQQRPAHGSPADNWKCIFSKKHNIQAHSTDSKYIIHIPQTKNTQTKTTKTQNNRKHITDAFQMMHMPLWCLKYEVVFPWYRDKIGLIISQMWEETSFGRLKADKSLVGRWKVWIGCSKVEPQIHVILTNLSPIDHRSISFRLKLSYFTIRPVDGKGVAPPSHSVQSFLGAEKVTVLRRGIYIQENKSKIGWEGYVSNDSSH